ncbi:MAG: DUF4328 domain-containing protein [Actinomycetota bacterium]|nr:DUF4328 domain-containing protein [Actinomycetota bacterium]
MQPGWYPDPFTDATLRWWDGNGWTASTHVPGAQWVPPAPDPSADLRAEEDAAAWATRAVLVSAAVTVLGYLVAAWFGHALHQWFDEFRQYVDAVNQDPASNPPPPNFFLSSGAIIGFELIRGAGLAAELVFMVWLRRAATLARRAGLPARREPYWAILGFFIPIVALWFPYQVAADLFASGDPRRRLAARWWGWYLTQVFAGFAVVAIGWFSVPIALIAAVALAVAPVRTALNARAVIAASAAAHRIVALAPVVGGNGPAV